MKNCVLRVDVELCFRQVHRCRNDCALQIDTTAVATCRSYGLECSDSRDSIFVYIDRFELHFEQKN